MTDDDCVNNTTKTHDNINNNSNSNNNINNNISNSANSATSDEGISGSGDKEIPINISNNYNGHSSKFLSSQFPSSSKGRSKYRHSSSTNNNNSISSLSDSSSTSRYRHSKKHISLDDEIIIYESDSSLIESRRVSSHYTNCNRINFNYNINSTNNSNNNNNQGQRSSVNAAAIISRHKSEENPITQPSNQIVSILKRKDSSGKESPSLVTFSPNVKDNNFESNRSLTHRQGILKKRSSLDESSRRYRSHSPSSSENEKGCLVKNDRRRNSCEEIHHHGILKQKSYESTGYSSSGTRSSGVNTPNSGVQGILKKPSLTPSDHSGEHSTKHVSISEAVILAAAELCKDMIIDDSHEPYIKPILKLDNDHGHEVKPKPILKKNHSSENEEIRSILKSRKSSREEQDDL